jgi:hypothetical protein
MRVERESGTLEMRRRLAAVVALLALTLALVVAVVALRSNLMRMGLCLVLVISAAVAGWYVATRCGALRAAGSVVGLVSVALIVPAGRRTSPSAWLLSGRAAAAIPRAPGVVGRTFTLDSDGPVEVGIDGGAASPAAARVSVGAVSLRMAACARLVARGSLIVFAVVDADGDVSCRRRSSDSDRRGKPVSAHCESHLCVSSAVGKVLGSRSSWGRHHG